ncbi:sugar porter family MFS transporter [Fulvivirga ligni]|uniref:sugar porter family MFS transporter n=1 Tax=Fulvivirga ligni TaxID=2904246 RepID=UPI001F228F0C|nr:sugar porter family MFS transporter [Fulvivirga ligni]UII23849.1 sugar porter family MFS transporter [Fulvivirga ligni]
MKKNQLYPVLISVIVALGGFLLGFDGVVNSGAITFYKNTFNISSQPLLLGISTSAILLGSILGNLTAGMISDAIGRKKALLITAFLFMLGASGTALAGHIIIFIICKFVAGIGVGIAILVAPMYIAEMAPPENRGKLVTINQLNIVLGLSIAYFSNYYILQFIEDPDLNWRWMLGIGAFPAALYFILLFIIPESPRWLIQKGRLEEAKFTLNKVRDHEQAVIEFQNIQNTLKATKKEKKAKLSEVFSRRMKVVLIIGLALAFFQQVSGINAVLYYAPMIFETAGGATDTAFLQAIIVGIIFMVFTVLSMLVIDRLGRKPLLIIGTSIMAAFLVMVGYSFYIATYKVTDNTITSLEQSLKDSEVLAQAKATNPKIYQKDSIVYIQTAASVYKNGQVIAEVQHDTYNTINYEIKLITSVLERQKGKVYTNELDFFSTLKTAFSRELQMSSAQNIIANQELSADEVTELRFADAYKQVILGTSININANWVLIGILGFIAGFSISLGPVMWAILSEIFPNRSRGLAISVAGSLNALTSFAVATIFPYELEKLGSATTFFIFAAFMILCLFFVLKYVVETKGKSLEEIEAELIDN